MLISGSRHADRRHFDLVESKIREHLTPYDQRVIHGGARGVDRIAADYARLRKLEVIEVPAAWATMGRAAGPFRNAEMLELLTPGETILAFPAADVTSAGTWDLMRQAASRGHAFYAFPIYVRTRT